MLPIGACIQESGPLWAVCPFMEIGGIEVGSEVLHVQRDLPHRMGAVDNAEDSGFARTAADLLDRENERGRRRDMAEEDDLGARGNAGPELLHEGLGGCDRHRHWLVFVDRARLLAQEAPAAIERAVFLVACQNLVAGLQMQAAGDDVHAGRGVGDVDEVVGAAVDVGRQRGTRFAHQAVEAALVAEELHRLALQLALPPLVFLEHNLGRGAERAVVQEGDVGIEQEQVFGQGGLGGGHRDSFRGLGDTTGQVPNCSPCIDNRTG